MGKRMHLNKIYNAIKDRDCKIVNKVIEEDGTITFEFAGHFDINMPAGTTDKEAIKKARKIF